MRVLINGVSTLKPRTGVGHTTVHLHRALAAIRPKDCFWLYPGVGLSSVSKRVLGRGKSAKPAGTGAKNGGSNPSRLKSGLVEMAKAAYRVHLQVAARWGRFDLYHEPNFVPIRTHLPTVVTVHDLSVLLFPEWHPTDRVAFHERHFRIGVEAANHVVVVSESVRREVIRHLGLAPKRVTAVPNGISEHFRPQSAELVASVRQRLHLPARYLVYVGTIEPRKNVLSLLRAFCDLSPAERAACPLVLAGGWGWKSEPERAFFESEARHRGVIHLGYVDDRDLPAIYTGATALLYPSFYEGFGLPPVEMLACGGRVIASTADAIREVVGGHAELLDANNLMGWRDAMRRVIRETGPSEAERRAGIEHAHQFSWRSAAQLVDGVYRKVLGFEQVNSKQLSRAA